MPATAILLPSGALDESSPKAGSWFSRMTARAGSSATWMACTRTLTPFRWQPGIPGSSSLRSVPITSRFVPPCLDLLGLDANGAVHAAQFHAEDGSLELVAERVASTPGGYLAAARAGTNGVVAIAARRIDWLERAPSGFRCSRQ